MAGDFDVVVANAELFERDWRRAGTPVASNLAIGAYAAATVHGMLGDPDARDRWIEIAQALLPPPERFDQHVHLWKVTLDAFLALHLDQPRVANELLGNASEPPAPVAHPVRNAWLPWCTAAWAEASVLTANPTPASDCSVPAQATYGNEIVAIIVERAKALHDRRPERLATISDASPPLGATIKPGEPSPSPHWRSHRDVDEQHTAAAGIGPGRPRRSRSDCRMLALASAPIGGSGALAPR